MVLQSPGADKSPCFSFVVTQSNNTSALNSARNLIQLPPEALEALRPGYFLQSKILRSSKWHKLQ